MKKKLTIILLSATAALAVLFVALTCFVGFQVFWASTQLTTDEDTKGVSFSLMEKSGIDYDAFCAAYNREETEIISTFDGHTIPADYLYAEGSGGSRNFQTVILVHGLGGNRYSNYPLAEFFLKSGYNVITYDQRSSNENEAPYTTFGYYERYDLADWVHYLQKKAPEQSIGIWGTSFGGATAGLALGYEGIGEAVDFVILDCPVSSMKWMIEKEMEGMDVGLPVSYMTWCGNLVNRWKLGFGYEDADVSKAVRGAETPVLIINSKKDETTPYFMGKEIYDALPGKGKKLWTVEDSNHAEVWFDHNLEYRQILEKFIDEN